MHNSRRAFLQSAGAIGIASMAGCSSIVDGGGSGDSITIGSKQFAEQEILGHMAIAALRENTDLTVNDETGLGGTSQCFNALKNDEIDCYWTYTGTLWHQILGESNVIPDGEKIYTESKSAAEDEWGLTLTEPTGADASWTIVSRPDWAEEHGIQTISDFASYVNDGNTDMTFVSYTEYAEREDGLPALIDDYGIEQSAWDEVKLRKVGYGGLNYQILSDGQAVATSGWQTQPQIYKYDLRILDDDKGHFSKYWIVPMIQQAAVEENPVVKKTLNEVAPSVTTEKMQQMALEASEEDRDPASIARDHLSSEGLI
ncbi:glycine betaine ABC transporter substrate-binding protein [Haloferax marisrubri]|uniref:Glycine/betaine ABC transporter substrate-binding protein n=1 Tax=Haloferax marisrubri TaxID=1544719 RepID=A0A2P4NMA4_9EURY|nr:glycine betaine ABC transporter substrate-binding protein [Haloferax marisrubri]POG54265.1 glycine/betaine ABC transporter substrate-binding protein [Haloferax marisrubri]